MKLLIWIIFILLIFCFLLYFNRQENLGKLFLMKSQPSDKMKKGRPWVISSSSRNLMFYSHKINSSNRVYRTTWFIGHSQSLWPLSLVFCETFTALKGCPPSVISIRLSSLTNSEVNLVLLNFFKAFQLDLYTNSALVYSDCFKREGDVGALPVIPGFTVS